MLSHLAPLVQALLLRARAALETPHHGRHPLSARPTCVPLSLLLLLATFPRPSFLQLTPLARGHAVSSLTALTLHHDRLTASRRTPPIPQLSCRGSPCATYQPPVVQCVAVGSSGLGGLEWKCDADLPRGVRFGTVEVGCEGWDAPGDDYVLRGSCALEYELVRAAPALEDDYAYGVGGGYGAGYKQALPASLRGYLPRSSGSLFNCASLPLPPFAARARSLN